MRKYIEQKKQIFLIFEKCESFLVYYLAHHLQPSSPLDNSAKYVMTQNDLQQRRYSLHLILVSKHKHTHTHIVGKQIYLQCIRLKISLCLQNCFLCMILYFVYGVSEYLILCPVLTWLETLEEQQPAMIVQTLYQYMKNKKFILFCKD